MNQVLIVDDDVDISNSLKEVFEDEGFDVHCSENGMEAMKYLHNVKKQPSLILLDLMMPIMNGEEFRDQQKHEPKIAHIPTMFMSAGGCEIVDKIKKNNEVFVKKPIELDNLLSKVQRLLASSI